MENSALDALICPVCGLEFMETLPGETALACIDGHSFDIARQGYANLLTGHGTKFAQDTAEMVAARDDFLDAGHYQPLANALSDITGAVLDAAQPTGRRLILDAGTGTGYYLQQVLARLGDGGRLGIDSVGLDISKFALRRAARRNPGTANLVWDLWRPLPVAAGRADVVFVIFAPRNAAEFARVLKQSGRLVVVTPRPEHLAEIARPAGMLGIQPEKDAALAGALAGHFELVESLDESIALSLAPQDVRNVALMGPAGHHLDAAALSRSVDGLPERSAATAAFRISVFRPVPES
ncbi:SAM-dependent methyltransferase [Arthrobacter sp. ERGS1:01]|uniref:putative RNA methyltransferase n=1 Tax=Arthrobacter sp. ERGS1:01 TaxID=1704044 RepID=UPI0006B4C9F9|nr:methyltransferase domain-containing protein [Arthrobacter sp. ERGS1:01]ALE06015.1 SAM-dependent methyltransferase [Arthrobacter sp. ERGS1:01]